MFVASNRRSLVLGSLFCALEQFKLNARTITTRAHTIESERVYPKQIGSDG